MSLFLCLDTLHICRGKQGNRQRRKRIKGGLGKESEIISPWDFITGAAASETTVIAFLGEATTSQVVQIFYNLCAQQFSSLVSSCCCCNRKIVAEVVAKKG